jgi:hypothetical protein
MRGWSALAPVVDAPQPQPATPSAIALMADDDLQRERKP